MAWSDLAVRQDGVVSRTQLVAAGVSQAAVTRMSQRGELRPVAAGVYLVRGAPLTYRARLWVAVTATQGVLGFATAAHLWDVIDVSGERVHVVLPHARRVYPPAWVQVHRVPVHATAQATHSELPTTGRAWTLCDYLPTLPAGERARLADRAVQRGWLDAADIDLRLRRYPGRAGNRALRMLLSQLSDGAAAKSERVLHQLLRQAGITGWVANHRVWQSGELVAVVDVAIPARRIAIEIDGWAYHHDVERFQRDRARQNALVMLGWTILRFTWADLTERPDHVRRIIAAAVAA